MYYETYMSLWIGELGLCSLRKASKGETRRIRKNNHDFQNG